MMAFNSGGLFFNLPAIGTLFQDAGGGELDMIRLFFVLGIMLLAGKLSGEGTQRLGQPAVIGELLVGALLGASVLGIIPTGHEDPLTEIIKVLAEIGVVVLLFEIGLEIDLKGMLRVGKAASSIAVVGVVLPLVCGAAFWLSPLAQHDLGPKGPVPTAVFLGATLTATSVGLSARVLQDLNAMHSVESKLIIGAAVIDDILGLVLLGVVSSIVAGGSVTVLGVGRNLGAAIGFLVLAVGIGILAAPKIFDVVDRMRVRGMLLVTAFSFALCVTALAGVVGSQDFMIVGAFAAGVILSGTNQFDLIQERIKPVTNIFAPIFFLSIGAQFNVKLLNPLIPENVPVLVLGGILLAIAGGVKLVSGYAAPWRRFNRLSVGVGMMPRGEVGLIFAGIGLAGGVFSNELFGAVVIMVIGTTLLAPPLLKWSFTRFGLTDTDGNKVAGIH